MRMIQLLLLYMFILFLPANSFSQSNATLHSQWGMSSLITYPTYRDTFEQHLFSYFVPRLQFSGLHFGITASVYFGFGTDGSKLIELEELFIQGTLFGSTLIRIGLFESKGINQSIIASNGVGFLPIPDKLLQSSFTSYGFHTPGLELTHDGFPFYFSGFMYPYQFSTQKNISSSPFFPVELIVQDFEIPSFGIRTLHEVHWNEQETTFEFDPGFSLYGEYSYLDFLIGLYIFYGQELVGAVVPTLKLNNSPLFTFDVILEHVVNPVFGGNVALSYYPVDASYWLSLGYSEGGAYSLFDRQKPRFGTKLVSLVNRLTGNAGAYWFLSDFTGFAEFGLTYSIPQGNVASFFSDLLVFGMEYPFWQIESTISLGMGVGVIDKFFGMGGQYSQHIGNDLLFQITTGFFHGQANDVLSNSFSVPFVNFSIGGWL